MSPDQFPGTSGDGWATGWERSSPTIPASVSSQTPIDDAETNDNYLSVPIAGAETISRGYGDGGASPSGNQVIQFDYSFNSTSGGSSSKDYIMLFGSNAAEPNVGTTDTWLIEAHMNSGRAYWAFGYLRHGMIIFKNATYLDHHGVATPLVPVTAGIVYQFTIDVSFTAGVGSYTATVRDTQPQAGYDANYLTPKPLAFCSNVASTSYLNFGLGVARGEMGQFSVDTVRVSAPSATSPQVFCILGLNSPENAATINYYKGFFTSAGIDTEDFRWYDYDYDSDPNAQSEADASDPSHVYGTTIWGDIGNAIREQVPVVLMGFSYGGYQAVVEAADLAQAKPAYQINDMITFDPVDYTTSTGDGYENVGVPKPGQTVNALNWVNLVRDTDGFAGEGGNNQPYGSSIVTPKAGWENLNMQFDVSHPFGLLTPEATIPLLTTSSVFAPGAQGDPADDTAEIVEDAVDGIGLLPDGSLPAR